MYIKILTMKQKLFNILLLLAVSMTACAQIDIKDKTLVFDNTTHEYLCSVPESAFDDGSVAAFACDTATIRFTFLPIVHLHGTFNNDYTNAIVDIISPEDTKTSTPLMKLYAKVKWRGGTSNRDGIHKRNYHVKFLTADGKKQEYKLFGMRKDDSWLMGAANNDLSRIRNRAAMNIWNEFAVKPYYADREPKAKTGTSGQFVEVFLNNRYMGIYDLSENIDRSLTKVKKLSTDDDGTVTVHGQLWKTKGFYITSFGEYPDYDSMSETWGDFETKYPDLSDMSLLDYSTLYDFVRYVNVADVDDFNAHISEYVDMPVLIDYFMFVNVIAAVDNYTGKNVFWACYDKQEEKKLTILPWDLDCTVGRYFQPGGIDPYLLEPTTHDDTYWANLLFYRLDSCETAPFHQQVLARYKELRKTYLSYENISSHYTRLMDMLTKSGAYARETERWSGDTDLFGQTLDFAAERDFITNWLKVRLETFDTYGFPVNPEKSGITPLYTDAAAGRGPIFNLSGQRLSAITMPGIYIVNGRKMLKK